MDDSQVITNQTIQMNQSNQPASVPTPPPFMNDVYTPPSRDEKAPNGVNTPPPSSPVVDETAQLLLKEMQKLRQDFDAKVKYDQSKERLIETLHRELQTYQEGLHFRVLRPVFTDLMTLYDDINQLVEGISASGNEAGAVIERMVIFQETVEDILRRNGAESFTVEGPTFQPNRQRVLRVIPTFDPAQDKQIARRVRKGFVYEDIVLRSEMVEVFKYTPPNG